LALRGPGSFTGLRVGLATVLGLHQAIGIPATALPTLQVLAMLAPEADGTVVAVVDALRDEWFAQEFALAASGPPRALAPARIVSRQTVAEWAPATLVGFGIERLAATVPNARLVPASALADAALRFAASSTIEWDPQLLTAPLYLRAPAVTPQPA
jgi:tRNA threonylcarbamoyl adenosine modification protein YeaZ